MPLADAILLWSLVAGYATALWPYFAAFLALDLLLAVLAPGTEVAGVLTRSKTRSAPVDWCAIGLRDGEARALVASGAAPELHSAVVAARAQLRVRSARDGRDRPMGA